MNKAMELLRRVFTLQQEQEQQGGIEFIIDPVEEPILQSAPRLEVNCTIIHNPELTKAMSSCALPGEKIQFQEHAWLPKPEDFKTVWIYNVSELPFVLDNVALHVKVPGCEEGKEYAIATSIPEIYRTPKVRAEDNEVGFFVQDGKRVAQDLINPQNLGLNQDDVCTMYSLADGCNYNERGVFWSTHNPPLKTELKAAHKRLKKYYQNLLDRANIERSTAVIAKKLNMAIDEVRAAEEYLA